MTAVAPASRARLASAPPDVETRLVELARSGAPLRRVLAAIAGRLVAMRASERLGFARLGDYAIECTGLSARQLQDLAHVHGALAGLPRIDAAFVAGRLTWTKTRLVCRVATAEDEALWIEAAERMTARALAREVRAVDAQALEAGGFETDEDGAEEAPRETVWLRLTHRTRARWRRAKMLACRVAARTLADSEVAELVAAEVMSAFPLEVEPAFTTPLTRTANGCAEQGTTNEAGPGTARASDTRANGCAGQEAGDEARPVPVSETPVSEPCANGCAKRGVDAMLGHRFETWGLPIRGGPTRAQGLRARRLALHRARLHELREPPRPSRPLSLGRGLG